MLPPDSLVLSAASLHTFLKPSPLGTWIVCWWSGLLTLVALLEVCGPPGWHRGAPTHTGDTPSWILSLSLFEIRMVFEILNAPETEKTRGLGINTRYTACGVRRVHWREVLGAISIYVSRGVFWCYRKKIQGSLPIFFCFEIWSWGPSLNTWLIFHITTQRAGVPRLCVRALSCSS